MAEDEPLWGSDDIQSMADLDNRFEFLRGTKIVLADRRSGLKDGHSGIRIR